jgi:hypothetical protein
MCPVGAPQNYMIANCGTPTGYILLPCLTQGDALRYGVIALWAIFPAHLSFGDTELKPLPVQQNEDFVFQLWLEQHQISSV